MCFTGCCLCCTRHCGSFSSSRTFRNILLINLIYKATGTYFSFLRFFAFTFTRFLFLKDFFFFFLHSSGTFFFFPFQFFFWFYISGFRIIHVILHILRLFFPEFRNHIKNNQKQNNQTENNQSFNAFCSNQQISHISNGNDNLRNIISNLDCKCLVSRNRLICNRSCSFGCINIRDGIFICLGIFLNKNRCTYCDFRAFLRNCICNGTYRKVRRTVGLIHDHSSHSEKRWKNKPQHTDQSTYHNKMYNKFQYFWHR